MRNTILLDVDGVIADLVGALCNAWNADSSPVSPTLAEEDVTAYGFRECLSEEQATAFNEFMARPGFCTCIAQYYGAPRFVERLHVGHFDVVAVTKPFHKSATWAAERTQWLKGFGVDKVIHTGHKEYVRGDYLIEDSVDNALKWRAAWPEGRVVLIDRPWNRQAKDLPPNIGRVHTWDQAIAAVHDDHQAWTR